MGPEVRSPVPRGYFLCFLIYMNIFLVGSPSIALICISKGHITQKRVRTAAANEHFQSRFHLSYIPSLPFAQLSSRIPPGVTRRERTFCPRSHERPLEWEKAPEMSSPCKCLFSKQSTLVGLHTITCQSIFFLQLFFSFSKKRKL